jgi:hypothetical protein
MRAGDQAQNVHARSDRCRTDFARIVNRLAECVSKAHRDRILEEPAVVAGLHRVIDRLRRVCAYGKTSLRELPTIAGALVDKRSCRIIYANLFGCARRQQVREAREGAGDAVARNREPIYKRSDKEVAIDILEQRDAVRADVAHFRDVFPSELVLYAKRPLLRVGRAEIRRDNRLAQEDRV